MPADLTPIKDALANHMQSRYAVYPEEGQRWCITRQYDGATWRRNLYVDEHWGDVLPIWVNAPQWLADLVSEVEALRVQVAHLSEDLIAYGNHGSKCDGAINAFGHGSKCDCGFHEALGSAEAICWQTVPAEHGEAS